MISSSELEKFRNRSFDENAVDINDVEIHTEKQVNEKLREYAEQTGNPYFVKVNDITAKLTFGDGKRLADALVSLLQEK